MSANETPALPPTDQSEAGIAPTDRTIWLRNEESESVQAAGNLVLVSPGGGLVSGQIF